MFKNDFKIGHPPVTPGGNYVRKRKNGSGGVTPLTTKSSRNFERAAYSRAVSSSRAINNLPSELADVNRWGTKVKTAVAPSTEIRGDAPVRFKHAKGTYNKTITVVGADGWEMSTKVRVNSAKKRYPRKPLPLPVRIVASKIVPPRMKWYDSFIPSRGSYVWHKVAGTTTAVYDSNRRRTLVHIPISSNAPHHLPGVYRGRLKMPKGRTYMAAAGFGDPTFASDANLRVSRTPSSLVNGRHVPGAAMYPDLPALGAPDIKPPKSKMPRISRKDWRNVKVAMSPSGAHWRNDEHAMATHTISAPRAFIFKKVTDKEGPRKGIDRWIKITNPRQIQLSNSWGAPTHTFVKPNRAARKRNRAQRSDIARDATAIAGWVTAVSTVVPVSALPTSGAIYNAWYSAFRAGLGRDVVSGWDDMSATLGRLDSLLASIEVNRLDRAVVVKAACSAVKVANKVAIAGKSVGYQPLNMPTVGRPDDLVPGTCANCLARVCTCEQHHLL